MRMTPFWFKRPVAYPYWVCLGALGLASMVWGCRSWSTPAHPMTPKPEVLAQAEAIAKPHEALVTAPHPLAAQAAKEVFQRGGNAIDAAVATALAIGVVQPFAAGIGGGGFALIWLPRKDPAPDRNKVTAEGTSLPAFQTPNGKLFALDFRERAPLAVGPSTYLNDQGQPLPQKSLDGFSSAGVPGTVAGLWNMHKRWGVLPWSEVVQPALRLAQGGFAVDSYYVDRIRKRRACLNAHGSSRSLFIPQNKELLAGQTLVQKDLAFTLSRLAHDPLDFYTGETAQKIGASMKKHGGYITLADLKQYSVKWHMPLCRSWAGLDVCSMPPPSSGGVHLLQALLLTEPQRTVHKAFGKISLAAKELGLAPGEPALSTIHAYVEALKVAYADRSQHLGDPEFSKIPTDQLLSPGYLKQRRDALNPHQATPSPHVLPGVTEHMETSHLNTADAQGNSVSLTFSVNYYFGSCAVPEGTGIVLNDTMDDFALAPGVPNAFGLIGNKKNAVAPRKTPLSSMTPVVALEQGKPRYVLGAIGGSTIITSALQVLNHMHLGGMTAAQAVAAPRFHHQWQPDVLRLEPGYGQNSELVKALEKRGYTVQNQGEPWGNASAIRWTYNARSGQLLSKEGGADGARIGGTALAVPNVTQPLP